MSSHTAVPGNGLCDTCIHQRLVPNTRGSVFSLCRRSKADRRYPRYPRVPVASCPGHEPNGRGAVDDSLPEASS